MTLPPKGGGRPVPVPKPAALLSRFSLEGKVAVVTGGASGIGRAATLHLASAGAAVCIVDRDEGPGQALAAAVAGAGGHALFAGADVTDEAALAQSFATAATGLGGIDVLVNNAGIAIRAPALDLTMADWNKVVAVNLTAMFLAARHAARHMASAGKGGAIVNTASVMGLSGGLYPNVAYQSTKGGVVNMTRALAVEWAPLGIRVNAVAPTFALHSAAA